MEIFCLHHKNIKLHQEQLKKAKIENETNFFDFIIIVKTIRNLELYRE